MKLALVNPPYPAQYATFPPLGLGYIASYLMKYGNLSANDIRIIDMASGEHIRDIIHFNPDIVAVTATTPLFYNASLIAQSVKAVDPYIPMIIGGVHVTLLPNQTLRDSSFDIGVIGEGELTMLELFLTYERRGCLSSENIGQIKGLAYKKNGTNVTLTPPRSLIQNLDTIPPPARKLMRMREFYLRPKEAVSGIMMRATQIMTSRGCPYNCAFCCNSIVWHRKVRTFSARYVVEEIKQLIHEYKIDGLYICDDIAGINKEKFMHICELMVKEKINERLMWACETRSDLINETLAKCIRRAGCGLVQFGFESGSQKILDFLNKGTTVEKNSEAVKICKRHNLRVCGFFMVGSPGETKDDILKTFKFIKSHSLDFVGVFITTPFPGTQLWEFLKDRGIISEETANWKTLSLGLMTGFEDSFIYVDSIEREEFKRLYFEMRDYAAKINEKRRTYLLSVRWINSQMVRAALSHPTGTAKLLTRHIFSHLKREA